MQIQRSLRFLIALLALLVAGSGAAFAQFSSAIEGTVTDNTGATIPGAQVVLTNQDTGVATTHESNDDGVYRFSALGPGTYRVTVTVQGFAPVIESGVVLAQTQVRTVAIKLAPASVTESVQINAAPTAVDTDEAKISAVIDAQSVEELPIQGRNVYALTNQTPGVTGTGTMGQNAANADIFYATTTPAVVANGAPNHGNTYLLDGVSLDDSPSGGDAKLVPNPDSVDEVIISTSNYSAEFGKASSLVTQITSKSGTNKFHGSGFEQYQNSNMDARTEFQNTKDQSGNYITPNHRNEFGGSFGGPIRRDSTFFFGSYDQVISTTTSVGQVQVEDPAFVAWMKANRPNNLSTSLLTQYAPTVGPATSVQTVANLQSGQKGPTDCKAADDPSGTGPLGIPCDLAIVDTANGTSDSIHNGRQYNVRLDQTFAQSRDRIYGNMYNTHLVGPWDNGVRHAFDIDFPQDAWFGAVNYTHVFSPSILNEAAFGYTRTTVKIPCKNCNLLPVNINNFTGFGDGFAPVGFAQNDFHWRDMVSITRGKHTLKTGFEWFHNQDTAPFTVPDSRGQAWGFTTIFDFADDKPDTYGGISFDPKTGGVGNNTRYFHNSTYGAYVQDDWKVEPGFTVNLGLRWDAVSNPSEAHDVLSTLTLGTGSTLLERIAGTSVGLNPDPNKRRPFIDLKKTYFAPRFGFAWQPFGLRNWSVRGGAGVFFDRGGNTNWSDTETGNPPITANFTADVNNANSPQPPTFALCASSTFPYGCPLPAGLTTTLPPLNPRGGYGLVNNIGGPDPHLKMAYAENFFVGVQHSFLANWIVEADYIHSNTVHEYSITNLNRVDGMNSVGFNSKGALAYTVNPGPNPYFNAINYADNAGASNYNGFTTYVRKSFNAGYTFQVSYTVQKTIDLISTVPGVQKGAENSVVIDAYNVAAQRGLSSQDTPKQLSYNGLYIVPAPKVDSKFLRGAVGGWQVSALGTMLSGFPATVFTSNILDDFNLDGNTYDLPNVPSFGATIKGQSRTKFYDPKNPGAKGTFVASDFPLPVDANGIPLGHEGTLGRNTYRGPGFVQTDGAVAKDTKLPFFFSEAANLQFRLDVYNLFNRVNLNGYDTNLNDGNFGKAGGTSQARTLQLSTKVTF
jgi:hypothetical protein